VISALEQMLQERINSDMPSPVDGCLRPTQGLVFGSCTNFEPHGATLKLTDLELYSLVVAAKAGTPFQLPLQQQSLGHKLHPILNSSQCWVGTAFVTW